MYTLVKLFIIAVSVFTIPLFASATPAPKDASANIISPKNGAIVSGPVKVIFGLSGMGVAPAGTKKAKTGHFHVIINDTLASTDKAIPSNATHKHFGGGQIETTLDLPKGKHTLQLVMGDHAHVPHKPAVTSEKITITVE